MILGYIESAWVRCSTVLDSAVSMLKAVISLVLILSANKISKAANRTEMF